MRTKMLCSMAKITPSSSRYTQRGAARAREVRACSLLRSLRQRARWSQLLIYVRFQLLKTNGGRLTRRALARVVLCSYRPCEALCGCFRCGLRAELQMNTHMISTSV